MKIKRGDFGYIKAKKKKSLTVHLKTASHYP